MCNLPVLRACSFSSILQGNTKQRKKLKALRGDLFVCHVTGAQKYNLLCFSVGRLIKKDGCMIYLQNKTKIQRFWKVRQRENHARSLGFFAYITTNMAVISNNSDICILVSKI